jgi:hypothetical protein
MNSTKSEIKPTSIITSVAIVGSSIVVDFNNFAFNMRLCISDLEDNISTIDVKDEKGEWYPKRIGTQAQILAKLAKYLPDGLTVESFMADARERALLLAGDEE